MGLPGSSDEYAVVQPVESKSRKFYGERFRRTRQNCSNRASRGIGPDHPLLLRPYGREPLVQKTLQAPALIRFDRIEVALRVGRDAMERVPLARVVAPLAERG